MHQKEINMDTIMNVVSEFLTPEVTDTVKDKLQELYDRYTTGGGTDTAESRFSTITEIVDETSQILTDNVKRMNNAKRGDVDEAE